MDEAEAEETFARLALNGIEKLLREGLIALAHRGLATLDDLALLDELEDQRQPQPLAA